MAIQISGTTVIDNSRNIINTTISGTNNTVTVDGTNTVGFRNIPQNSRSANYTLVLADAGKYIFHPSADTTPRTFTIPANSSVAFPIGTAITFINQNGAGVITIAITTDTMRLSGDGTPGAGVLAANGIATIVKITATEWIISGTGLTIVPQIGQAYGGGFFAGQISTTANSIATHNLVIGPLSTAENSNRQWKTTATSTPGTSSVIDGPANTSAMDNASHPAAQFCAGLSIGGFSDWYMPAENELQVCYFNLKPTTDNNETFSGINPNAVPARASNYTNGPRVPDRTSAVTFQSGGAEPFASASYWSSTEISAGGARSVFFFNGSQGYSYKTVNTRVRAVRRVAV